MTIDALKLSEPKVFQECRYAMGRPPCVSFERGFFILYDIHLHVGSAFSVPKTYSIKNHFQS